MEVAMLIVNVVLAGRCGFFWSLSRPLQLLLPGEDNLLHGTVL